MAVLVILSILLPLAVVSPVRAEDQDERGSASAATWSRTYLPIVGPDSVQVTSDGGFVASGHTRSSGAWVMKASPTGEPEWEKGYIPTGYGDAEASSVQQTRDRGYIAAGAVLGYVPGIDAWLLKLDHMGNVEWSKTYGGSGADGFNSVQQTSDGGYIAAGLTESFGQDVQISGETAWVVRVDPKGNVIWQKDFGADEARSVQQTSDGGFIVAGTAAVLSNADAWLFKLDMGGNMVWQKTFEITIDNRGYSVQQTHDGGFVLVAEKITIVFPSGNHVSSDTIIFRLDPVGNPLWQRSYSGGQFTQPSSVRETSDGGIIVSGRSSGPFLLKLGSDGNIVWQKVYGVPNDFFDQVQETKDRGLIVAGWLFATGSAWLLKLNGDGSIGGCPIGVASNGTLTGAAAIATNPNAAAQDTNGFVRPTGVTVNVPMATVQTQCLSTRGERAKGRTLEKLEGGQMDRRDSDPSARGEKE